MGAASCPWPEITHTCTATDSSFADPGVRTAELVQEFGVNGLSVSICDANYAPESVPTARGEVASRRSAEFPRTLTGVGG